jgi:DNA-binding Lrp family transcriptional regulator
MALMKLKLDETDRRILGELQQNSSRPIHELADIIGISMASCTRRVKRMEQSGLIQRYVALLNPEALGLDLEVFISIRLSNQTLKTMEEFRKIITVMPEVVECYALTGNSDFLLHVRTTGVKEYNTWMQEKLIGVSSIFTTQSNISLECIKYSTALPITASVAGGSILRKTTKKRKRIR